MRINQIDYDAGQPVDGYGAGYFRLGTEMHEGPLAILPGGVVPWRGFEDMETLISRHTEFDVVFFGTGDDIAALPIQATQQLDAVDVGYELMSTPSACRTYNVLLSEGRRVALAVIPVDNV